MEGHGGRYSAGLGDYCLNAKDNFEFSRTVPYRQQRKDENLDRALDK
jgi:hypothetical protein